MESDLRPLLDEIVQPTLWIAGDRDRLVPAAAVASASGMMVESRMVTIEGAGHAPFLSHPQAFISEVIRFAG